MIENWRILLYYPLGLLPALFFTIRLLIQWIQSEKEQSSIVTPIFWKLSLVGNLLQVLHYFIQVQYPFALLQASNAMIAWRNLSLMRPSTNYSTIVFLLQLSTSMLVVTLCFILQSYLLIGEMDWIRTPTKLWDQSRVHHSLNWHILGTLGGALFASRFWVQWWQSECSQQSKLSKSFWWLSIIGSTISLLYFIHINDVVSVLQYSVGLIPYFRNLMLMRRNQA